MPSRQRLLVPFKISAPWSRLVSMPFALQTASRHHDRRIGDVGPISLNGRIWLRAFGRWQRIRRQSEMWRQKPPISACALNAFAQPWAIRSHHDNIAMTRNLFLRPHLFLNRFQPAGPITALAGITLLILEYFPAKAWPTCIRYDDRKAHEHAPDHEKSASARTPRYLLYAR